MLRPALPGTQTAPAVPLINASRAAACPSAELPRDRCRAVEALPEHPPAAPREEPISDSTLIENLMVRECRPLAREPVRSGLAPDQAFQAHRRLDPGPLRPGQGRRVSDGGHVWWEDAVVYEAYPRSFADEDGDGMGDLPGLRSRLAYLADLGVDAVRRLPSTRLRWPTAGMTSATTAPWTRCSGPWPTSTIWSRTAAAHQIRVIIDLVPNHCSSAHPLFLAALAAAPGSPERRPVHLPRRARPGRRTAAEQLDLAVRRPGLDAGDRGRRPGQPTRTFSTPASLTGLVTRTFPCCSRT